jgi:hypothetical protein
MTSATLSPETTALLQGGKLEQTCPDCGRWSAASSYCSWCFRAMSPTDWYRNGDPAERAARMPQTAPLNPPSEYRHSLSSWPKSWGKYPGKVRGPQAPRDGQTPLNRARGENNVSLPTWTESELREAWGR